MFETLDKLMLAGLGAISMTRDRAEKIFDEAVERGQAQREGKPGFVQDVMDHAEHTRSEMERIVSEQTRKAVEAMGLATKEDITRLEAAVKEHTHSQDS